MKSLEIEGSLTQVGLEGWAAYSTSIYGGCRPVVVYYVYYPLFSGKYSSIFDLNINLD